MAEDMAGKTFYLIRHGESMGNIGMDSGVDPPLSPRGLAQAKTTATWLAERLDADTALLSSPFERCVATAAEIAAATGLRVELTPPLHELFLEEWFPWGKTKFPTLKEIAERRSDVVSPNSDDTRWWPDKHEDWVDVDVRMGMFRNILLGGAYPAPTIVCVGHWASVQSLAKAMVHSLEMPFVENASVTKIIYRDGEFELDLLNFVPENTEEN